MTLIAATTPNSAKNELPVKAKTPKPIEVVRFAKKRVCPIFSIVICKASILSPCKAYSSWYLFKINIVFGTPITTINDGIIPEIMVIL